MNSYDQQSYRDFINARCNCPVWVDFVAQFTGNDAVAQLRLQEFAGYLLHPGRELEKGLLLYGHGLGKSTLARVLAGYVAGPEKSQFLSSSDMTRRPFVEQVFAEKLMVWFGDGFADAFKKPQLQMLKMLLSNDLLPGEVGYYGTVLIDSVCKVVLESNNEPRFDNGIMK